MKDAIDEILEENKDLIVLQEEKAKLLPKNCEHCGRDLTDWTESKGEACAPGEYITMMSIANDYAGGVGGITYTCQVCLEHMSKYHMPGEDCTFPGECLMEIYKSEGKGAS